MRGKHIARGAALLVPLFMMVLVHGCGRKKVPYDTNLLANPSFEQQRDGVPVGWRLELLHGMENQKAVLYGESTEQVHEGAKSFYFKGEEDTQRWLVLTQEVRVPDAMHVRLRGALKAENARRHDGQWTQCNFLLMFFDENHQRFQELRYADKRTMVRRGSTDWIVEDKTFRVPHGTRFISVGCVMGMSGTVWFDDLWLSIPKPVGWVKQSTKNFDFYSLPGHDFPKGSVENQQQLFDGYCTQLGVTSDLKLSYYLYPDTATIREHLSLKGAMYVSWDDHEIHSVYPNNDHEIIHFLTDQYGKAPKAIAEGCVLYLQGGWEGTPVHVAARELLLNKRLPSLNSLLNYGDFVDIDPRLSMPAAASFFGYISERRGMAMVLDLFRAANGANSYSTFAAAFGKVYQADLGAVEAEWHAFLSRGPDGSGGAPQTKP